MLRKKKEAIFSDTDRDNSAGFSIRFSKSLTQEVKKNRHNMSLKIRPHRAKPGQNLPASLSMEPTAKY
jgi:hypothetical protein